MLGGIMGYLIEPNLLSQHITFPQPKPGEPEFEEAAKRAEFSPETPATVVQPELDLKLD